MTDRKRKITEWFLYMLFLTASTNPCLFFFFALFHFCELCIPIGKRSGLACVLSCVSVSRAAWFGVCSIFIESALFLFFYGLGRLGRRISRLAVGRTLVSSCFTYMTTTCCIHPWGWPVYASASAALHCGKGRRDGRGHQWIYTSRQQAEDARVSYGSTVYIAGDLVGGVVM